MDVTNSARSLILQAIRNKGLTQSEIAQKMGYGKAWISKLLNGSVKRLSDADAEQLEVILEIQFFTVTQADKVSGLALEISRALEDNEQFAKVLTELLPLVEHGPITRRRYEDAEMTKLGQEIINLASANEDNPEQVARDVLKLFSE